MLDSAAMNDVERTQRQMSIADLRMDYRRGGLDESEVAADPFAQFASWFAEARAAELPEPNAMTLATSTPDGIPSARIVLLKGVDERGFVFYTNYQSQKGRELASNPRAALTFYWAELERQVRIAGAVARVSREESRRYFDSRPIGSRLGASLSHQSNVIPDRTALEAAWSHLAATYEADPTRSVPLPDDWGGYRLSPGSIEFWQGRPSRLHDRLRYGRQEDGSWRIDRLSP